MVRSAILSWAAVFLLGALVAESFGWKVLAEVTLDLAVVGFIIGLLIHVIVEAGVVLRQSRRPAR